MSFGEGDLHEQVKRLRAELEAERAKKRYEYVVDGKCESYTERRGYYMDAETIANQQEHIAELERELALARLKASDDFKPRCDVCDRTTLLVQIEALKWLIVRASWPDAETDQLASDLCEHMAAFGLIGGDDRC